MANDLNQCQFIGRLGQDPEMRYMPSGDAVASFSVACGEKWKDKQGVAQERTEWVNCAAFGKLAEIIGEYLKKGSQVFVSGKMKTEKYQAQDGTDRYSTKIIVQNMQMLGSRDQGQASQGKQQGCGQQPQPQQRQAPQQGYAPQQGQQQAPRQRPVPQPQAQQQPQNFTPNLDDGWDDDIPF